MHGLITASLLSRDRNLRSYLETEEAWRFDLASPALLGLLFTSGGLKFT